MDTQTQAVANGERRHIGFALPGRYHYKGGKSSPGFTLRAFSHPVKPCTV